LHPETPEDGRTLEDLFAGRGIDLAASMERLKRVAGECNLPWGVRTRTYNSRRAQELGKWAESVDKGDEYHMAVFQAYFANGLNIGRVSVLVKLAETLGLDGGSAEEILSRGTFKGEVDRDWEYSRASGITAVPTFLVGGQVAVGAQPYHVLAELVRAAGAKVKKHC
jgi:predicted DsbA family dithiol-disulfide isomerase